MSQLNYTMFHDVLFPDDSEGPQSAGHSLTLERIIRYAPLHNISIVDTPLVVFDFETTGLDSESDHIIEIGGLKTIDGKIVEEFSHLISSPTPISEVITNITGITPEMLVGMPTIEEVLPEFLSFIEGAILVAHNAEFDMAFLRKACQMQGLQLDWPAFCTLKLARKLLPDLESKNLDSLAEHYQLTFEARHRSIGDCKVTSSVLQALLKNEGSQLRNWQSMQAFAVK